MIDHQQQKTHKSKAVILDEREKVKLKDFPPNFSQHTFITHRCNKHGKINSDY